MVRLLGGFSSWALLLLSVVVLLFFLPSRVEGDAAYMCCSSNAACKNHASCTLPLKVGTAIMVSSPAIASSTYSVIVTRDGVPISSPFTFYQGDTATYTATVNADVSKVDFAIEINNGGSFKGGSCTGSVRIDQDSAPGTFIIPKTVAVGTTVSIWAGFAQKKVTVGITPSFQLIVTVAPPPTPMPSLKKGTTYSPATTRPTPSPTSNPTTAPTLANNFLPTANKINSFPFSCPLTPQLSIHWSVVDSKGVAAQLVLDGSTTNWFSAGVVAQGETEMVATMSAKNLVWIFKPNTKEAGLFALNSQQARDITAVSTTPTLSGITAISTQQTPSVQSTLSLFLSTSSDSSGVHPVSLGGGYDTLIYAHSDGAWPAEHPDGARGFTKVYWSTGVCEAVPLVKLASPYLIWLPLLLVALVNSPHSPIRQLSLMQKLNNMRVPSDFMGISDYSYAGLVFIALYLIVNMIVFFYGQ